MLQIWTGNTYYTPEDCSIMLTSIILLLSYYTIILLVAGLRAGVVVRQQGTN